MSGLEKSCVFPSQCDSQQACSTLGQEHLRMQWLYPRAGRQWRSRFLVKNGFCCQPSRRRSVLSSPHLACWHPDQYPVYHGASAMIAKVLSSREIPAFAAASFSPLDTCSATTRTRDHVRRKKQPVSRFIAGPAEPPRVLHKRRRERSVTHAEVTVPTIAVDASSASPPRC